MTHTLHRNNETFVFRTQMHINLVRLNLMRMIGYLGIGVEDLSNRARVHDQSKFGDEEREGYRLLTEWYERGGGDGMEHLRDSVVDDAMTHHRNSNRHHPEFHEDPNAMTDLDIVEMVCDWTAISQENNSGRGSCIEWAMKNVGRRWDFDAQKRSQIFETIRELDHRNNRDRLSLVTVFPEFEPDVLRKIEAFRRVYDRKSSEFIGAHMTISPLSQTPAEDRLGRCWRGLAMMEPFSVVFQRASVVPPSHEHRSWYAFLEPVEGDRGLVGLHNEINSPRSDFFPHLCLGSFGCESEAVEAVEQYNDRLAERITATVRSVAVHDIHNSQICTSMVVPLGSSSS